MQPITKEKIQYLAVLSKIALTEEDCEMLASDLTVLSELAENLEPLPVAADRFNGAIPLSELRVDEVKRSISRDVLLENAPLCDSVTFLVPRTVEE